MEDFDERIKEKIVTLRNLNGSIFGVSFMLGRYTLFMDLQNVAEFDSLEDLLECLSMLIRYESICQRDNWNLREDR